MVFCQICKCEADFMCKCSGINEYFCETHLSAHASKPKSHSITPCKIKIEESSKRKFLSKLNDLKKNTLYLKNWVLQFLYAQMKTLENSVNQTLKNLAEFEKYLDLIIIYSASCTSVQIKENTTFVDLCLQEPSAIDLLTLENYPKISMSNPLELSYSNESILNLLQSIQKPNNLNRNPPLIQELCNLPQLNIDKNENQTKNTNSQSKKHFDPHESQDCKELRYKTERNNREKFGRCIMCNSFDDLSARHCGHESCRKCFKQRCIVCGFDDEMFEKNIPIEFGKHGENHFGGDLNFRPAQGRGSFFNYKKRKD